MANEIVEVEDEIAELPNVEEGEEDLTDYKALAAKNAGIAKRYKTKFEKSKIAKEVEKGVEKALEKKEGFDYAEKAYLKASGITSEEYSLVSEVMQATGKSLDEVLEAKYFQASLKERREEKASKDAIPSGSKRSTPSSRTEVEYWLAKGELPPYADRELRAKVVNAKIKAEQSKNMFTERPVV